MTKEFWLKQLKGDGCRLTKARKIVVETLISSRQASTPHEIFESARQKYPAIGLVTIYRTLEKLEQLGLVRRIHQDDGCNAYLPNEPGHNHVIICSVCGRADYFEGDDLLPLFKKVNRDLGYQVRGHLLQLTGLCGDCQTKLAAEKDERDRKIRR